MNESSHCQSVISLTQSYHEINLRTKCSTLPLFASSIGIGRDRGNPERFAAFLAATSERDPAIHQKREKWSPLRVVTNMGIASRDAREEWGILVSWSHSRFVNEIRTILLEISIACFRSIKQPARFKFSSMIVLSILFVGHEKSKEKGEIASLEEVGHQHQGQEEESWVVSLNERSSGKERRLKCLFQKKGWPRCVPTPGFHWKYPLNR